MHEKLSQGIDVLDVGCGSGTTACVIAAAYPNTRVIGVDMDQGALQYGIYTTPSP
jgi:methylase of polypeptide subunit release factors